MEVEIIVYNDDRTVISALDIEEEGFEMVFQLSDIAEPDKSASNFVRRFTIKATKNNNQFFEGIYEPGFYSTNIKLNRRINAVVKLNGNDFFKGTLQINEIIVNDGLPMQYNVTIYSSITNLFEKIGGDNVNDLDISEYNHIYSVDNVMATWLTGSGLASKVWTRLNQGTTYTNVLGMQVATGTNTIISPATIQNYIYKNGLKVLQPQLGDGYVYPYYFMGQIDHQNLFSTDNWIPSIYAHTILKKIKDKYSIKIKSKFFESEFFKRLIIPPTTDVFNISQETIDDNEFCAWMPNKINKPDWKRLTTGPSSLADSFTSDKIVFTDDNNNAYASKTQAGPFDHGDVYNTSTGIYTVGKTGTFNINTRLNLQLVYRGNNGYNSPSLIASTFLIVGDPVKVKVNLKKIDGAVLASATNQFTHSTTPVVAGYNVPLMLDLSVDNLGLVAGDKLYIDVVMTIPPSKNKTKTVTPTGQYFTSNIDLYIQTYGTYGQIFDYATQFKSLVAKPIVYDGDEINLNDALPDMPVKDFLLSLNRLFNLYWQFDGDKTYIVEPYDDTFKDSQIVDIYDLVDRSEDIIKTPLSELTNSSFNFSYKEDSDYYNATYKTNNDGEIYGSKILKDLSDFYNSEGKIETSFAPSPMVNIISKDIFGTAFVSKDNTTYTYIKPKTRLLYFSGLKQCTSDVVFEKVGGKNGYPKTTNKEFSGQHWYPMAAHMDDGLAPTLDLNYGLCKEYFYTWNNMTTNNLFNKYWRKYIKEITSDDAHMIKARLFMPNVALQNFDLTWIIQFDNVYYRINKLTANPLTQIADIELVKFLRDYTFTPKVLQSGGSIDSIETWERTPLTLVELMPSPSLIKTAPQNAPVITGKNNLVAPSAIAVLISGNDNNIQADVKNVSINGNRNTVLSGVTNVNIIGDNQIVAESNITIIDCVKYKDGQVCNTTTSTLLVSSDSASASLINGGKNSVNIYGCIMKGGTN
jgi:hypothetical protein